MATRRGAAKSTSRSGYADNADYDAYDDDEFEGDDNPFDEDDEEEDERPARSSRGRKPFTKAQERPERGSGRRSRSSGDDEDEKPARARSAPREGIVGKGMASYKEKAAKRSTGYDRFDIKVGVKGRKVIKFLEPECFANFWQHWVPVGDRGKRRPYVCHLDGCPLCAIGDRSKPVLMFNVVDMSDGKVKVWAASSDPAKRIEERIDEFKEDDEQISDPGVYFIVSKSDEDVPKYKLDLIGEKELQKKFDIEPLGDDELEELEGDLHDEEIIFIHSLRDLQKVADELVD